MNSSMGSQQKIYQVQIIYPDDRPDEYFFFNANDMADARVAARHAINGYDRIWQHKEGLRLWITEMQPSAVHSMIAFDNEGECFDD